MLSYYFPTSVYSAILGYDRKQTMYLNEITKY